MPAQIVDQRGALFDQPLVMQVRQRISSSTPASRAVGRFSNLPAERRARPRARRSDRTSRAPARSCARSPSGAARPGRPSRRDRAGTAQSGQTHAGSPRTPTPARRLSPRPTPAAPRTRRHRPARPLTQLACRAHRQPRLGGCPCADQPRSSPYARPFSSLIRKRTTGGQVSVGALPRSYQVTPAVLERRRATTQARSAHPGDSAVWVSPTPSRTIHHGPLQSKPAQPRFSLSAESEQAMATAFVISSATKRTIPMATIHRGQDGGRCGE